jgi:sugar phosphate permease
MGNDRIKGFSDIHRWLVFGVFSLIYFFVYFHRVSTSVIAHDLLVTFQTNATALGLMSSMYFYFYALEQPLVGHLSDILGPQRVVGIWSLVAAIGCIIFGLSPSIKWAAFGRGIIGFGVGGVYVPAMKAFSQWFKKREFATMTGFLLASGNIGAIVATTPLAWVVSMWGWRVSFFIIGSVTFLLAILTLFIVHDFHPSDEPLMKASSSDKKMHMTTSGIFINILTLPRFWMLAAIFFCVFGTYFTFQGLWATPFLMSIFKIDRLQASGLNMLIPVGFILGAPLYGWLADKVFKNKVNVLFSLLAIETIIWVFITFYSYVLGKGGMAVLLLIMGGTAGGLGTTIWSLVRETTDSSILGITTGLLNPFPILGAGILQAWTGAMLDRAREVSDILQPLAYRGAFLLCLSTLGICLIVCGFLRRYLSIQE